MERGIFEHALQFAKRQRMRREQTDLESIWFYYLFHRALGPFLMNLKSLESVNWRQENISKWRFRTGQLKDCEY
jgi:hypothetical protein